VVHIENRLDDPSLKWINEGLRELLTAGLADAGGIQVISSDRVRELIARRTTAPSGWPEGQSREIAREAHADFFLSGALAGQGSGVRLDYQVSQTPTGRAFFTGSVEGSAPQAIASMTDEVCAAIRSRFAPGRAPSKSSVAHALTGN